MARGPGRGISRRAALLGLLALSTSLWAEAADPVPAAEGTPVDPSLPPPERARALAALASRLVDLAASSKAHATGFRIDVAHYRESLRDLVKENDARAEAERLPRPLILDLVRMTALLQSAAECQTGRYIVCPPDLMTRLRRQRTVLEQGLAALPDGT
jgi:hypothetical protein